MTDILKQYPATLADRLAQLQEIRSQLLNELHENSAIATQKQGERWSIAEIAHHIHIVESLIVMMMKGVLAGKPGARLSDEDLTAEWHKISSIAGNRQMKIEAPDMVVPKDSPSLDEGIKLLEQSRAQLHEALANATIDQLASVSAPHPIKEMGVISGAGWLTLLGWHELRHVDQIRELKAALAQSA